MSNKKNICQDADQVLAKYIEELSVDTSHHRMLKQETNVDTDLQASAANCVLTDRAVCLRQDQKESAEPMRIPSQRVISCVR